MSGKFISLVAEWQNKILSVSGVERDYNKVLFNYMKSKPIKIVTGFRRSGKSFLVQMVASKLVSEYIYSINNICYLNFEDYRLIDLLDIQSLGAAIEIFLNEMSSKGPKLLIFDEVQEVKSWHRLIRTFYEKETNIEIILTGSNSELLSSEIGSNLAGRFIELSIQPFNFIEILQYKNINISSELEFYKSQSELRQYFSSYVSFGGMPEILTIQDDNAKYSYLQGIISKVILDDVVKRFSVRNAAELEKVVFYIYASISNIVSSVKITNLVRQHNKSIKADTVTQYIDYIIKSFAIFSCHKFDWKLNRIFDVNNKYYAIDTGLMNLYGNTTKIYSQVIENIVYLELRRRYKKVYFGSLSTGKEIDFIVQNDEKEYVKFQVCVNLTVENEQRELSSFYLSDEYLGNNNILLTMDDDEKILDYKGCKIKKLYLLKWLLLGNLK